MKRNRAFGASFDAGWDWPNVVLMACLWGWRALAAPPAMAAEAPTALRISIVGTNDLHGHTEALPVLGGYINNLRDVRARDGGAVLLMDAGDMFQGTLASNLTEGQAVVDAYNKLGYAAVTIGNHEFDFGPEGTTGGEPAKTDKATDERGALRARARQAKYPFLTANVVQSDTGAALAGKNIAPSALLSVNGVSVGLVGVTTIDTPKSTLAANFAGLAVRPLVESIVEQSRTLRRRGATVVVVLAHAGGSCARFDQPDSLDSCKKTGADAEILAVANALPVGLVDAIVAGHTHAAMAHRVANIPIIESYSSGRAFGRVDLILDRKSRRVLRHELFEPQTLCRAKRGHSEGCEPFDYEGRVVTIDQGVAKVVQRAERAVAETSARPLKARATSVIRRDYDSESPLGNLLVDLMLAARPKADVALANGGGIRKDLPAGPVTYGGLYEVMPFDNTFATAKIPAARLAKAFAHNLQSHGGFLSQAGLRISSACVDGKPAVTLRRPNGDAIADNETLTVVTNSFLATGGDGALGGIEFVIEPAPPLREELARVLQLRGELRSSELFSPQAARHVYEGKRPLRCR